MKTYFKDNFFSAGKTDIWNEQLESLGYLDLRGAFGSALEVYDAAGQFRRGEDLQRMPDQ
ncbi:MAG: hypothetical protein WD424_07765 [Paenibacillaceae bacterium]